MILHDETIGRINADENRPESWKVTSRMNKDAVRKTTNTKITNKTGKKRTLADTQATLSMNGRMGGQVVKIDSQNTMREMGDSTDKSAIVMKNKSNKNINKKIVATNDSTAEPARSPKSTEKKKMKKMHHTKTPCHWNAVGVVRVLWGVVVGFNSQ